MNNLRSPVLLGEHLYKSYSEGQIETQVLSDVSLSVSAGEALAIVGSSGSGKSTLLHLLGGLDKANQGRVSVAGKVLGDLSNQALAKLRNQELGFIYQFHHLLGEFSALENAAMPLLIAGMPKKQAYAQAQQLLERVGLGHRLKHRPSELSGGERQRTAIARALVNQPKIVLADEPTGNLDSHSSEAVYQLLLELNRDFETAFVVVTHDLQLAQQFPRVETMSDGQFIRAEG